LKSPIASSSEFEPYRIEEIEREIQRQNEKRRASFFFSFLLYFFAEWGFVDLVLLRDLFGEREKEESGRAPVRSFLGEDA
jgi:hypothetical protein